MRQSTVRAVIRAWAMVDAQQRAEKDRRSREGIEAALRFQQGVLDRGLGGR
jgi:hypothetical protein